MYAGYGQGRLTSVIIINSVQANSTQAIKGSLNVTLSLESYKGQTLYLSYLTADGADSQNGTVWNGLQYSNLNGTSSFDEDAIQKVTIGKDGTAVVNVRDSQALIAYVGSRLGSNQVLLNSTIPDDDDNDGNGNGTSTSTGSPSSSTHSGKSQGAVLTGPRMMTSVFMIGIWSLIANFI